MFSIQNLSFEFNLHVFFFQADGQNVESMNSTTDTDILADDVELVSGLLDALVLLWMGIQPHLRKVSDVVKLLHS